jgi:hypothetical protein
MVVLSAIAWPLFRTEMQGDFSARPSWEVPTVLVGFAVFGAISMAVLRPDKDWSSLSWHDNPFDMSQPLQSLHLSGWCFMAGSATLLVLGVFRSPSDWAWVLPASLGVGFLAAVRVVSFAFGRRGT